MGGTIRICQESKAETRERVREGTIVFLPGVCLRGVGFTSGERNAHPHDQSVLVAVPPPPPFLERDA